MLEDEAVQQVQHRNNNGHEPKQVLQALDFHVCTYVDTYIV